MQELRELTLISVLLRTLFATLLSGIIGMERGMKNRAAGFRTYMLVCIGSCMVMMTNQYTYQILGMGDPVRLGAQVVSGIGFLGAGSIIVTSHNQIKGLTTAAGLWTSACLGLAVGIGFYEVALVGGVVVFLVLTLLHTWEERVRRKIKTTTVYIELSSGSKIGDFLRDVRKYELSFSSLQFENDNSSVQNAACFVCTVKSRASKKREEIIELIRKLESVSYIEEL